MSALFFTCKANWVRVFLLGDVVLLNKALCLTDLWSALSRCCQSFMALILECWGEISTSCSEHCYLHQGLICCSLAKPAYISTRKLSSQDLGFTSVRLDLWTFISKIPAKCLACLAFLLFFFFCMTDSHPHLLFQLDLSYRQQDESGSLVWPKSSIKALTTPARVTIFLQPDRNHSNKKFQFSCLHRSSTRGSDMRCVFKSFHPNILLLWHVQSGSAHCKGTNLLEIE